LLLGLMFGGAYRFAIGRSGLFALALIGYIAHYTAYLTYDNLLSFTLIAFYDLVVVYVADRLARRATLEGAPAISAAAA
jgi:hypothetical protein